jgi:hypothetical protein
MAEPIRFWVLPSEEPIDLDGRVFVRTYQSKEDAFVFGSDEPVEMVELSTIREEFRTLLQTVLDEGFGIRETLPLDQVISGIEQGISKLHQERETWRDRAEKMDIGLQTIVGRETCDTASELCAIAKESLKP